MITATYQSPLGAIQLAADDRGITGLWFVDARPGEVGEAFSQAERVQPFSEREGCDSPSEEVAGADCESGSPGMTCESPCNATALSVIERAWGWLNSYFAGQGPLWLPPLHLECDELEHEVCAALLAVPYGEVVSCDELLARMNSRFAGEHVRVAERGSVCAVLESLPIALMVPVHRVDAVQDAAANALRNYEQASLRR